MACTVVSANPVVAAAGSEYVSYLILSGLTAGLPEQVYHKGPTGCTIGTASMDILTPPTDGSLLNFVFDDTDTTNDKLEFRVNCPPGGSADGAVIGVTCRFIDQGTGGLSTITTT